MEKEGHAEAVPLDKDVLEENASVTVVAQVVNVDPTVAEPPAENVYLAKPVSTAYVLELAHHNVLETTEPSEPVVGIAAEAAVVVAQKASDVVTEFVSVTPTVRTSTVDLMVVAVNVEPVLETELSVKEPQTPSLNNARTFATLTSESKSERKSLTDMLQKFVPFPSVDLQGSLKVVLNGMVLLSLLEPSLTSPWKLETLEKVHTTSTPTALVTNLTLKSMLSPVPLTNSSPSTLSGKPSKSKSETNKPTPCCQLQPSLLLPLVTLWMWTGFLPSTPGPTMVSSLTPSPPLLLDMRPELSESRLLLKPL
jgi:hypothetical protein